ncbi:hypothetical protein ACWERV_32460 [Streptomyces sp. NPDC004031]
MDDHRRACRGAHEEVRHERPRSAHTSFAVHAPRSTTSGWKSSSIAIDSRSMDRQPTYDPVMAAHQ